MTESTDDLDPIKLTDLDPIEMKKEAEAIVSAVEEIKEAQAVPEEFLFIAAMKRIPLLASLLESTGLLESTDDAGWALSGLFPSSHTTSSFDLSSVVLSALDFVKIPFVYFAAFVLREKLPPFNVARGAKMLYSGIGVGLGLTIILVPGVAPLIAIATGALGVIVGAVSLGNLLLDRATTTDQLEAVRVDITKARALQNEVIEKKQEFDSVINDKNLSKSMRELKANRILIELHGLEMKFSRFKLQDLFNNEAKYEAKLKKMSSPILVMDKSVGVVVAAISLIGAITLLVFPPAGLGILAASALLGGAYLLGRIATPWVKKLGDWFKSKFNQPQSKEKELKNEETKEPELDEKLISRRSSEVLLDQVSHPDKHENQEIVAEVMAEAKKLQSSIPRSSQASPTPQTTKNITPNDVDSELTEAPSNEIKSSDDIKHALEGFKKGEDKKLNSNFDAQSSDKKMSDEDEEGEGPGKSKR